MRSTFTADTRRDFLRRHPNYTTHCISSYYPLTRKMLREHSNVLNWEEVGQNEKIDWTVKIIDEFKQYFIQDTGKFSFWFCCNPKLPWSVKFINRYLPYWEWEGLAQNEAIEKDKKILAAFHDKLDPIIESWKPRSSPTKWLLAPIEYNIQRYDEEPWLLYSTEEEIDRDPNIEWSGLSWSSFLPWSAELIRKYQDKWDWKVLSMNSSIDWTDEMIEEFQERLFWGSVEPDPDYKNTQRIHSGITDSIGRKWTPEQVQRYKDRIDWFSLSTNDSIFEWDFDLLEKYESYNNFSGLIHNRNAWQSCFGDLTREDAGKLLSAKRFDTSWCGYCSEMKGRVLDN